MDSEALGMNPNIEQIHKYNHIHPTAVIDDMVEMGEGNYVGPFCYLAGYLQIGNKNRFESHCAVGTRPEHVDFNRPGLCRIGDDNWIREFTTIHSGTKDFTTIGNNVIMLRGSHVAHDCEIEDGVTLSCDAIMLGHVHVMKHSNCGTGCQVHQHQVVGSYSMIGMGCVVPKKTKLEPGQTWVGNPARRLKTNMYALDKHDVDDYKLVEETVRYANILKEHGL